MTSLIDSPSASGPARARATAARASGWGTTCAGVALVLLLGVSFAECLAGLAERWANEPDYSHGFFVPVFAAFLLWWRRAMRVPIPTGGRWVGTGLVVASALIRLASVRLNYTLLEPMSLLPCLAGVALLIGGWGWLRWSWPAIAFLAFMIPLPGFVAGQLGGPLQRITTVASTYLLQTFDVPATATGNVIWLTEGRIGVVEACNGLRMLIAFFAVTIGAALVMRGSLREKAVIVLSAPAIGLFANIVRITATGLAHEWISPDVADRLFHDFAGWLMMPLAAGCLLMELYLLSRLLIAPIEGPVVRIKNDAARTAMKGA